MKGIPQAIKDAASEIYPIGSIVSLTPITDKSARQFQQNAFCKGANHPETEKFILTKFENWMKEYIDDTDDMQNKLIMTTYKNILNIYRESLTNNGDTIK